VIARHGCPDSIVTDQGSQLTSRVFTNLCTRFNIDKMEATAYHKQTNGKVEKFIQFLKRSMATILVKNQSNWAKIISRCLFVYRVSLNKTLDETPFYLVYGRDARLPQDFVFENNAKSYQNLHDYVHDLINKLREAYTKLNQHKYEYQMKYKSYYDKKQKDITFGIDDKVMVYFPVPKVGLSYKWVPKYDGPFKVVAKIDQLNYRIQDLKNEKRTFVVHVQRMLKWQDKTQESISMIDESENIGYRLMKAKGWHESLGLGKHSDGIIEPI
jgi:hypothetical protein